MRAARLAVLLTLAGCGGGTAATAPRPALGVQSNEAPFEPIVLRIAPTIGSRLRTLTRIEARATLLDRPITLSYEQSALRTVADRRPDGTTVFSTRTLGGSSRFAMGEAPRVETIPPDDVPRTSVMDARGTVVDDALFAPAPTGASGQRDRLRATLDSILAALAYPTQPLALRDSWGTRITRRASDLVDGASGELDLEITQELVRVEGNGPDALALIAVRGAVRGAGSIGGDRLAGSIQLQGIYSVAVADGLVRGLDLRAEGGLTLGRGVDVPIEATLRYRAEP